jgi:polyhydroxyalkanoate synthesis regulator phasin
VIFITQKPYISIFNDTEPECKQTKWTTPLQLVFSRQETAIDNTSNNRGRSSSRKRRLSSTSADLMKPPQSRQRSLSVTRQSVKSSGPSSNPVTFKTQGESFNMSKLVEETLLKPDFTKHIVPPLLNEIKAELISKLKSAIRSTVSEAIEEAATPLRRLINEQQNKIKCLENQNNQLKEHVKSSITSVEVRYEQFRNVANNTTTFIADNKKLKADNLKLMDEVSQLNVNIDELEQYGRRTSLRFHNVPMAQGDLQKTDQIIVDNVNIKLKITPPLQPYVIILNGASQLHDIDCLLKTRSYMLFINLCEKLLQGLKCWCDSFASIDRQSLTCTLIIENSDRTDRYTFAISINLFD